MKSPRTHYIQLNVGFCLLSATLLVNAICTATPTQSTETRRVKVIFVNDKNQSLDDIQEQDVEVMENGVRQHAKIEKQHLPVRYALVVDTSGSLRTQFPRVLETARAFIRANTNQDETALVRFVDSSIIQAVQTFTTDKSLLLSHVEKLVVQRGQTALVDAVYASLEYVNREAVKDPSKNDALVLITDGENRQSNHSLEELAKYIENKNIRIYTIGLISDLDSDGGFIRKTPKQKAEELLLELAKRSGGRTFFVKSGRDFPEAIAQVTHDLRSDYLVSYTSSSGTAKAKIEIKVVKSPNKPKRLAIFKSPTVN